MNRTINWWVGNKMDQGKMDVSRCKGRFLCDETQNHICFVKDRAPDVGGKSINEA